MNKHLLFFIIIFSIMSFGYTQNSITLTFTGLKTDGTWQKLDSVKIINSDKNWSETLIYNDTTLVLHYEVGISENNTSSNQISTFPNPFEKETSVKFSHSGGGLSISLYTIDGKRVSDWNGDLAAGEYKFAVTAAAAQSYFLVIHSGQEHYTSKLICSAPNSSNKIELVGTTVAAKKAKGDCQLPFSKGDNMTYTGYCVQETLPQYITIEQQQYDDAIIPFIFQKIVPNTCPENATLTDVDGNIYNTVLIGKQCWMRENLKTTRYADSTELPLGNDTIHDHSIPFYFKYANSDSLAQIYGMLYSWTAAMRNLNDTLAEQVQGICPNGWHLPSDDEWCEMTSTLAPLSSCYDETPYFGGDEFLARQISLPKEWVSDNFTTDGMPGYWSTSPLYFNTSGFSALPTGYYSHGAFFGIGAGTYWWTTTPAPNGEAYCRYLQYNNKGMNRNTEEICHGFAIRCVMD